MREKDQTPSTRSMVSGPSDDPTRGEGQPSGDARKEMHDPREDRPATGDWVGAEDSSAQKRAAEMEEEGEDVGGPSSEGKE